MGKQDNDSIILKRSDDSYINIHNQLIEAEGNIKFLVLKYLFLQRASFLREKVLSDFQIEGIISLLEKAKNINFNEANIQNKEYENIKSQLIGFVKKTIFSRNKKRIFGLNKAK